MPILAVTNLKNKWHKRISKSKTIDLPTPPDTDTDNNTNKTKSPTTPTTATTAKDKDKDKKKKVKDISPSPDYLLNGISNYIFDRPLGHGKFSKVMLAKHYLTGEQYAIKVIDKRVHEYRVMSRLVREIHLMEVLEHPNVVRLYETIETADSLYLVMEYVPGYNLDEHLQQRHGLLNEDEARVIFRQMVAAVDYCHSKWVVHRDLKAPNVLLKTNGQVKLADFGLGNRFGLQRLRTMCGSMLYYSPEIICEQKYIGPEVDCWCLGVTLFRMTSGFEPFSHARTFGELRKDVISGNYPMPTFFSEGLQQTIRKCLSVDRRRRIAVRVALKDDPWLNKYGKLNDIFTEKKPGYYGSYDKEPLVIQGVPAELDDNARHRMERERAKRQCIKDIEEEKANGQRVKRTVVYHPINSSIYFTGNAAHSPRMEENAQNQELLRAELLSDLKSELSHVHLTPLSQPPSGAPSSIQQFFHKLKRPESILTLSSAAFTTNGVNLSNVNLSTSTSNNNSENGNNTGNKFSSKLKKTTSSLSLASLYHRPKEHINYYTIQTSFRESSSTTMISNFSISSSISGNQSLSISSLPPPPPPPPLPTNATTATTTATTTTSYSSTENSANNNNSNNNNNTINMNRQSFQQTMMFNEMTQQQQDECELILLVQSACQLLGVTYQHESRTKLICVLTLRNYTIDGERQNNNNNTNSNGGNGGGLLGMKKSKKSLRNSSSSANIMDQAANSQHQKQKRHSYQSNASSTYTSTKSSMLDRISNGSSTSRWSRQMKRLSAPFQQWPWSSQSFHPHSSMPIGGPSYTMNGGGASGATTATVGLFGNNNNNNNENQQQSNSNNNNNNNTATVTTGDNNNEEDDDDEKSQNKDGIVIFTMEAYTLQNSNNNNSNSNKHPTESDLSSTPNPIALRFVKVKGSTKVFKLATGWISGVLASSSSHQNTLNSNHSTPMSSTMNVV